MVLQGKSRGQDSDTHPGSVDSFTPLKNHRFTFRATSLAMASILRVLAQRSGFERLAFRAQLLPSLLLFFFGLEVRIRVEYLEHVL